MNLWKSIKLAWRRRKLCASPPPCPRCPGPVASVVLQDVGKPARWHCFCCDAVWWQETADSQPVAYGHPAPPDYAVAPQAGLPTKEELAREEFPGRWPRKTWEKVLHPDKHAKH